MVSSKAVMVKQNREWQAENDARTLADAAEISSDKARARRAVKAAEKAAMNAKKAVRTVTKQAGVKKRK